MCESFFDCFRGFFVGFFFFLGGGGILVQIQSFFTAAVTLVHRPKLDEEL